MVIKLPLQPVFQATRLAALAGLMLACSASKQEAPNIEPTNTASSSAPTVPSTGTSSIPVAPPTSPATSNSSPSETLSSDDRDATSIPEQATTDPGNTSSLETTPDSASVGGACIAGEWPSADPSQPGPYEVVTENNVGPEAGQGEDGGLVAFTVFRPKDLTQSDVCHPVITWGNGTGSSPNLYKVLLGHLASHGFIVVASDSPNVAQGDPPPMVAGVTWLLEENEKPDSPYFQRIDVARVGATGHSQGGFATTQAGGDSHISTIAPLCGASPQRNLHGPALLLCGGADEVVDCDGIANALESIDQPAMLAKYITADHADWVTFFGSELSPMEVATVAWMRVHLMGDSTLRSWFYGPTCKLCTDDAWEITQQMMDE